MIIVGAKGFAKEVLEIFLQRNELDNLFFFDNISKDTPEKLYGRFPVLRSIKDVKQVFEKTGDKRFCLGLGKPILRYQLTNMFQSAGGELTSTISPKTDIGSFGTTIAKGCNILSGAIITNDVTLNVGVLVNPAVSISHDTWIGEFVELGPGARITGNCQIGAYSVLGTNAVVIPRVKIGKNVVVGAGGMVTKDVPDNCMVAGVPAVIKKNLPPLDLY